MKRRAGGTHLATNTGEPIIDCSSFLLIVFFFLAFDTLFSTSLSLSAGIDSDMSSG